MEKEIYNTYGLIPEDFGLEDDDYDTLWDIINEDLDLRFDNSYENKQYVVTGSLGLWDGRHYGYFEDVFDSLREAINKCWEDTEDIKIYEENGHLYVCGYHHDGRNYFEIRELTQKGIDMLDDWYDGDICKVKYATKKIKYLNKYL